MKKFFGYKKCLKKNIQALSKQLIFIY